MTRNTTDRRLFGLLLAAIGLILLVAGGRDAASVIFGLTLTAGGLLEIPEVRLYLKVVFNRKINKQVSNIQESKISESTIVGNIRAKEFHIHQSAPTLEKEFAPLQQKPEKSQTEENEPFLEIDEDIVLAFEEYQPYPLEMDEGDFLRGEFVADGKISVYLLGPSSFKSFKKDREVVPYWDSVDVRRTKINFLVPETKTYTLVVSNENGDNEEEEDITVSVRFRVEP